MKKQIIASIAVGLLVVCTVAADDALPPDQIRAGEAKQTQIKAQTQNVALQLGAIIDEFKRNGLDGQDVEVLEAIRRVLGKLSDQEMKKVIDALQEARSAADASQGKKAFAGAVSDQKAIIAQLRALLLEYQRQQALYELSLRLAALAERQNANLKTVVDLAKMTGNATASRFDDTQRASLQIQAADQQGLKDEVNPLLSKLETLTKDADGATKDRLNKAMEQSKSGGLKPAMDSAIEDLKNAALYRAAGSEKIIRDQLRELSRLVAPPKDTLAALQAALKEIEKQIEAEKAIVEQTRKMDKKDSAEVENRQADVVDRTDAIRNDLAQIAPDASGELKNAQNQMQEARANLSEQRRTEALKSEAQALEKLESAKKALQEQIARTEPQQKPEDKLAATKQLQERTKEMIKKEEEIKTATASAADRNKDKELKALAPKQADLEEQTKDLSRDAAAQAPEAAQSIGEAAQQMDKSEKNLAKPQQQAKTAQEAQAAAISALKQAEEQLGKQAEQLEKAKQELADMMDSRAKIIKLIEGQQQVQLNTAKLAAKDGKVAPSPAKNKVEVNYMAAEEAGIKATPTSSPISSPKDLAPPQDDLAKRTESVKSELQESEKVAAQPLDDAKKNMVDAKGKLDANDAKRASPAQLEALVNLYKAKDALDKKIQDLQKQLGQEPQNADANAAAQKIEQLQQQVAKANEQLNADAQQMQKSLQQQQKEIADALQQMQKGHPQNTPQQQPLNEAQQAAQQAAQQLAQNANNEALKSMQKAQQGIEQAMKAQPQQAQAEKGQPEQGQPQQGQPEQGQPAQADAGQGQPGQGQPGQGQPGKGQPGQGQPGQGQPGQGQPGQGLPQLAQKQSDLQKQLEAMMQGDPMQQAAAGLEQAAGEAGQMASGQQGQLPPGANQAMQQAAAALAQAAAAAAGRDQQGAQEKTADAQAALAQAAAALSLAQAGLNGQMANAPGQGQPGQGQGQPGQGKNQQQGQGQGQPQNQQRADGPNNPNRSTGNRNSIQGGSFTAALPNKDKNGNGQYQGLPQRDRNAITQSRNDKYPEEYGAQVEQYLKNLADQEDSGK